MCTDLSVVAAVERDLQEIVVISEAGCRLPSSVTSRVDLCMKVLGTEWIVQCLIQGKQVENYQDFSLDGCVS